jgi:pimeloyl-ACP methyl ester carboxylesterase
MSAFSPYAELLAELPVSEHVATLHGSETHYWIYGPQDAAQTVVVVHGYRGEHHGLEPVIAQFRGVRFVCPDLPGFGESSELDGEHSVENYARWLEAFIAHTNTQNAVLLGHSFGSIVTSHAVANGLVTPPKLVLINPIAAPAIEGPSAFLTRLTTGFYRFSLRLPERLGYWLLSNWLIIRGMSLAMVVTRNRMLRRFVHDQHHTYFGRFATRTSVVEGFEASVSGTVRDYAARIDVPTLLIGAEKDQINSVANLRALDELMPNSTLHIIPNVGHLIHYETPRPAAQYIVDFVGVGELAPV